MAITKRTGLRIGFAGVIALLTISGFEAYRIHDSESDRHVQMYRRYADSDAVLSRLRRNIWLAGNYVRDFFIETSPEQAILLHSQIRELAADNAQALEELERLRPGSTAALSRGLKDFWKLVDPVPTTMLDKPNSEQYKFLQREVVPRRAALYADLRAATEADQQFLERSEAEFAATRAATSRRLFLIIFGSFVLALAAARLSLRYSEHLEKKARQQYEEVAQARSQLQHLSARLLAVEEENKKRLARELHDEIGQCLALLQIEISHAQAASGASDKPALRERLRRARELAERTVQTTRNISLLLRPALLDDLGLLPALQFLAEDFSRRSGIQCEIAADDVTGDLPDSVKTCAYRVVQETLHNCEKHAGASCVRITLRQAADALSVDLEDNGRGFETTPDGMPARHAGLGILGMRERVSAIGGSMQVDSSPGRGVRLSFRLPVAQPRVPQPVKDPREAVA